MNNHIQRWINQFAAEYPDQPTEEYWQKPLVAYASASDPQFQLLKQWTHPDHQLPADLLPDAASVIAYFLPFHPSIPESNRAGRLASRKWGEAYIHTNELISDMNVYLVQQLSNAGYSAVTVSATHNFNEETLMSFWSHRHVAYIAGLGQFGLNNLLITEKGCCGRIGTLVTNAPVTPSPRLVTPACLFKYNGSCSLCVDHCVNGSLSRDSYNRHHCYAMCIENAAMLSEIGLADVCGKCTVGLPCSGTNPVSLRG